MKARVNRLAMRFCKIIPKQSQLKDSKFFIKYQTLNQHFNEKYIPSDENRSHSSNYKLFYSGLQLQQSHPVSSSSFFVTLI